MSPVISVVTIAKNHGVGLTHTLDSLRSQSFQNWESIIVVGTSIDDTLLVAENYQRTDSRVRVVQQLDSGIYEAMNLGISESTKDSIYLNFMNAGDVFYSTNSMQKMIQILDEEKVGLLIGGYKVKDLANQYRQKPGNLTDADFTFSRRNGCHQAIFYSREVVLTVGPYDTSFRLAADHDLTLKVLAHAGGKKIDIVVTEIEPGGVSDRFLRKLHEEKQEIRRRYFKRRPWLWIFGYGWQFTALSKIYLKSLLVGKKYPHT
jgi:glycosyltransferase involved in cell wall biosynthesis